MKNKLQSLRSHLKNLKLVHVLLIILILVVFFGLFKREVSNFSSEVISNMPRLTEVTAIESYPCKGWQETKEWLARKEEIDNICVHGLTFLDTVNGKYESCISNLEKEFIKTKPKSIEIDTVCDKKVNEVWFRIFGKNWFKIK